MEGRAKDVQGWGKEYVSRKRPPLLAARGVHHSDWLCLIWFMPVIFCPLVLNYRECVLQENHPTEWQSHKAAAKNSKCLQSCTDFPGVVPSLNVVKAVFLTVILSNSSLVLFFFFLTLNTILGISVIKCLCHRIRYFQNKNRYCCCNSSCSCSDGKDRAEKQSAEQVTTG